MSNTVYDKIDPELKARWLTALRSGEYKQAVGALETKSGGNCCLGVLARIEDVPTFDYGDDSSILTFDFAKPNDEKNYRSGGFPPDDWRGLTFNAQMAVANMNDEGKSFDEIADFIEANF